MLFAYILSVSSVSRLLYNYSPELCHEIAFCSSPIVPTGLEPLSVQSHLIPSTLCDTGITYQSTRESDDKLHQRRLSYSVQYKVTCIKTEGTLVVHWGLILIAE